jgi:hypothetical protein
MHAKESSGKKEAYATAQKSKELQVQCLLIALQVQYLLIALQA